MSASNTTSIITAAQLINANKSSIHSALHNAKRSLTAQFNESKKKETEEKSAMVEAIAVLYSDLVQLNASIEQQKRDRRAIADANRLREQQAYSGAYQEVITAVTHAHESQKESRRLLLQGMRQDLEEKESILKGKQSAQLAALNPPRELTKAIVSKTHAIARTMLEAEAVCGLLTAVVDVEHSAFHEHIVEQESKDRNRIFAKEEERLLSEKKVEEDRLTALKNLIQSERAEKEMTIAQLILEQRQLQGDAEVTLHEIKQLEHMYDLHEKAVAERRFKKTAAYKIQIVQGVLNQGLLNPLKMVAKTTTDAILPKHEPPPSSEEIEKRSEERRLQRDQCTAYIAGLRHAIETVEDETRWMEQQTEIVKALLHNDDLGLDQLSARIHEVLQRRKPDFEEDSDNDMDTSMMNQTRRSVSSARSTQFSGGF